MQANAQDRAGAASLAGALGQPFQRLMDGGVDLNQVDTNDGQKIVQNIFGPNTDQVAQTLGGNLGGGQSGLIQEAAAHPRADRDVLPGQAPDRRRGWGRGRRPARIHPRRGLGWLVR